MMQTPASNLPQSQGQDIPQSERPKNCSLSGPCDLVSLGQFHDQSGLIGPVEVVRCRNCGLGISRPPIPDVTFLYADRNSQDFQPDASRLAQFIKTLAFRLEAHRLLKSLPVRPGCVIDFGCGSGLFTRSLVEALSGGHVIGIDFHEAPPLFLARHSYCSFRDASNLITTADVVLAMHVLEHDEDAPGLLKRIASFIRPGGQIIVEVPNIDCRWAKIFGRAWDAWYLPYHRCHFNKVSLRALLKASGFSIEREIDVCVPTMGRSVANVLGCRKSLVFLLLGVVLHPIQWFGERVTSEPSALRIVARKAD